MKKILAFIFVFASGITFAQFGIKLSNVRPTGTLGSAVKPTIGGEIIYKSFNEDEERGLHFRASLGFTMFKARKDTFPTYGVISGSGTTVTPGYTVIHKYNMISLSMGLDYYIPASSKLFFYPGIDVGVLFTSLAYDSYAPLISSEGYSGGYAFLSGKLRVGTEYLVTENVGVFFECARSMNFSPDVGGLAYNDYGFGIRLNF
jgi:hypothetical protein